MPNAQPPILVTDPETGTLRLLSSFPEHHRALLEHLISEEDMRCIWLDGHAYVAWDDVAPYTHEDGWDMGLISTELTETTQPSDPFKAMIELQGKSDDAVLRAKARLIATTARVPDTAANQFAHALQWYGFLDRRRRRRRKPCRRGRGRLYARGIQRSLRWCERRHRQ